MKTNRPLLVILLLFTHFLFAQEPELSDQYKPETYSCALTVEQNSIHSDARKWVHINFELDYPHYTQNKEFKFKRTWKRSELKYELQGEKAEIFDIQNRLNQIDVAIYTQMYSQYFEVKIQLDSREDEEGFGPFNLMVRTMGGSSFVFGPRGTSTLRPQDFFEKNIGGEAHLGQKGSGSAEAKQPWVGISCTVKSKD